MKKLERAAMIRRNPGMPVDASVLKKMNVSTLIVLRK